MVVPTGDFKAAEISRLFAWNLPVVVSVPASYVLSHCLFTYCRLLLALGKAQGGIMPAVRDIAGE